MMCHGRMDSSGRVDYESMTPMERMWASRYFNTPDAEVETLRAAENGMRQLKLHAAGKGFLLGSLVASNQAFSDPFGGIASAGRLVWLLFTGSREDIESEYMYPVAMAFLSGVERDGNWRTFGYLLGCQTGSMIGSAPYGLGFARGFQALGGARLLAYLRHRISSGGATGDLNFARRIGGKDPPPHPMLERWIEQYQGEYSKVMTPEDVSSLVRQIEAYRGPHGQRYTVKIVEGGPLAASAEGSRLNLPTQTRRWIVLEEWYHGRGHLEGFLKSEIEVIKKAMPVGKKPPGYTGKFSKKIYREDAAKEIAVKEYILKNHADLLTPADKAFIENQITVLRGWGVLYGY